MRDIVLIPAYQPNQELLNVVNELSKINVGILIINDGSGDEYDDIFIQASSKATVINIPNNGGKGSALKNGIAEIRNHYPECEYFVTADADGQHQVTDIIRVLDELHNGSEFVLTVRNFDKNMPKRSRIGNNISRWVYTILNSHYLIDNQSGLRGFSIKHADWLLKVGGEKYDYEMNMLYYADKQGITITTLPIEALYIDNNKSSHFSPFKDTIRIYKRLFTSAWVTFASILIMEQCLLFVSIFFGYRLIHITIPGIGATTVIFTILLNRFVAFRQFRYKDSARLITYSIIRYIIYLLVCALFKYTLSVIPIFFTFNFIALSLIPLEYLYHKNIYKVQYNDIHK